jgi:hypothetical protein
MKTDALTDISQTKMELTFYHARGSGIHAKNAPNSKEKVVGKR